MTGVSVFDYGNWSIRTIIVDDLVWFVAKDVCDALGYVNGRDAVAKHVDVVDQSSVALHDGTPGNPNRAVVNESGVYALIFGSKLSAAQQFKRWVFNDVLPSLRSRGTYTVPAAQHGGFAVPSTMVEALQLALDQARQLELLEERVTVLQPAAQAWNELADLETDHSIRDAAQLLSNDPLITIGQNRLMGLLRSWRWVDGDNVPMQAQVDNGRMARKPSTYIDREGLTKVRFTPRLTVKGIGDVHRRLAGTPSAGLSLVSGGQS